MTETNVAQAITVSKTINIGQVTETNVAQAITSFKTVEQTIDILWTSSVEQVIDISWAVASLVEQAVDISWLGSVNVEQVVDISWDVLDYIPVENAADIVWLIEEGETPISFISDVVFEKL